MFAKLLKNFLGKQSMPNDKQGPILSTTNFFAVIYWTQSSRDKIFTIYGIIHRYIYISYALKLRKLRMLKNDNIGP
jgi:hypothetical protein